MFNPEDLRNLVSAKDHSFKLCVYDAGPSLAEAEAARNMVGYFPASVLSPGDVVYVRGGGTTTHHYVTMNQHEKHLALCLLGG